MVELIGNALTFSFPEVHRDAVLRLDFQRTLRIPDDDRDYPLPPGLGEFPLRHVDDFARRVPGSWLERGGVMLPMYQSEALWINFISRSGYPFAVKVAAGRINAVTGDDWSDGLHADPQDYMVTPEQPWLDGYCVEKGIIRQFVAMPLGAGYTAEEQITGRAEHGGIQIVVYAMKASAWKRRSAVLRCDMPMYGTLAELTDLSCAETSMGLAPGGRMTQEIFDDPHSFGDWETAHRSRCFVHLANSLVWRSISGDDPPTTPPTADEYTRAGLPWFDYYGADRVAVEGSAKLKDLKTVKQLGLEKGDKPLPENATVEPSNVVGLRTGLRPNQVREGAF